MKNKKVLIPIIAIIAAILVVALLFLLLNNKSIQETRELNDVAQKIQKYTPDTPVEEIKDVLNKPVSDEEKQAFDELYIDPSTLDDVKATSPEEFVMPDEIPDNLELRVDDNGNLYYLELYPEEFSSLQEYEEYLIEQERQAEEKDQLNTNNTTDVASSQSSQENSNQNIEDEDMGITNDANTPTSQRRGLTLEDIGPGRDDGASDPNINHTPDVNYSGLNAVAG